MPGSQRVVATDDWVELCWITSDCQESLRLFEGYCLVVATMNDQPRRRTATCSCLEVEVGCMLLEIIEHLDSHGKLLAGPPVDDRDLATGPPLVPLLWRQSVEGADRCPGDQCPNHSDFGCSGKQCDAAASAVPDNSDSLGISVLRCDLADGLDYCPQLGEVFTECCPSKRLGVRDQIIARFHTTAAEVESKSTESTAAKELSKMRKEAPFHETLEAVAEDDRGSFSGRCRRMDDAPDRLVSDL